MVVQTAYPFSRSGNDCECDRGFREAGTTCIELLTPENAHLDSSGNAWMCNSGFVRQIDRCIVQRD